MLQVEGQLRVNSLGMGDPSNLYILSIDFLSNNLVDLLFEREMVARDIQTIVERGKALNRDVNGLKKRGGFKEPALPSS